MAASEIYCTLRKTITIFKVSCFVYSLLSCLNNDVYDSLKRDWIVRLWVFCVFK